MEEEWRDIAGYEGYYQVSSLGRVMSMERWVQDRLGMKAPYRIPPKILKPKRAYNGYLFVHLSKEGHAHPYRIHRMVAEAFIPNPDGLPTINHKDENKENNHVDNLEWCSIAYNNSYGTRLQRTATQPHNHAVVMLDMNGKQLRRFQSLNEAARHFIAEGISVVSKKVTANNIRMVCQHRHKTAYGYRWEFADE